MFIYGLHPSINFIKYKKNLVRRIFISRNIDITKILGKDAAINRIKIETKDTETLSEICFSKDHQGVVVEISNFPYVSDAFSFSEKLNAICVLDHINDPRNLGAIIRNAVAFDIQLIVLPKDRACEVTPVAIKASAGTAALLPIALVTNINNYIYEIKKHQFWVYGFETDGKTTLKDAKFSKKSALVFGSEGKGIASLTKKRCDDIVSIDFNQSASSLNVASSTAIVFSELYRNKQ